jgi:hypothetical protein
MKISIQSSIYTSDFSEFMDFNSIDYSIVDLWDDNANEHYLPDSISNCLFVVDNYVFVDILSCDDSYSKLIEFVSENKLWIISKFDCTMKLSDVLEKIHELDRVVPNESITLFHDCKLSDSSTFFNLQNIKNKQFLYNWSFHVPRIPRAKTNKSPDSKDFLLTMLRKKNRKHRDVLWQELNKKPYLLDHGITSFRQLNVNINSDSEWVGELPIQHKWRDGYPSMDLYNNCWLEIVPETFYKEHYFTTEKTIKPIATKTPFLMCSTPGYLDYFNNIGFRTFGSLIDESYDQITDLEKRCCRIVQILESIVDNGSEEFYNASLDILDHNLSRLSEIYGSRQYYYDKFFISCLEEL